MLDSDLAKLYCCKNGTKSINLAVKRHIIRFPERFMFQLTEEESKIIWFQIETKYGKIETCGGKFDKPYVFTEQGIAMLATVIYNEEYHDRYFIKDKNKIYHSGNSINHIGYRKSSINMLEDNDVKKVVIEDVEKILSF